MDGLEAARRIIEMDVKTPIVALTANIMANDREAYFEAGMKDCLSKPFVAYDLWTCLLKYLKPVSMLAIQNDITAADEEEQRFELIAAFVKSNKNIIFEINEALGAKNIKLAHRIAHTLKNTADLVGMKTLAQAALNIEQALSSGYPEFLPKALNEQILLLGHELNNALNELTPIADSYSKRYIIQNDSSNSFDKEESLRILNELDVLLTSDSFDSLSFVKSLSAIPGTNQLVTEVEDMKFKTAREMLAVIKEQINAM
jgi:CheY-like chemotaxis protein